MWRGILVQATQINVNYMLHNLLIWIYRTAVKSEWSRDLSTALWLVHAYTSRVTSAVLSLAIGHTCALAVTRDYLVGI